MSGLFTGKNQVLVEQEWLLLFYENDRRQDTKLLLLPDNDSVEQKLNK